MNRVKSVATALNEEKIKSMLEEYKRMLKYIDVNYARIGKEDLQTKIAQNYVGLERYLRIKESLPSFRKPSLFYRYHVLSFMNIVKELENTSNDYEYGEQLASITNKRKKTILKEILAMHERILEKVSLVRKLIPSLQELNHKSTVIYTRQRKRKTDTNDINELYKLSANLIHYNLHSIDMKNVSLGLNALRGIESLHNDISQGWDDLKFLDNIENQIKLVKLTDVGSISEDILESVTSEKLEVSCLIYELYSALESLQYRILNDQ